MKNRNPWEMPDDELEQYLLRHGRAERAPGATRQLILASVLAGSALATTPATAGIARGVWWLAAKWLVVGATSGVVIVGLATSSPLSSIGGSQSQATRTPVAASGALTSAGNSPPAIVDNTPVEHALSPTDASSSQQSAQGRAPLSEPMRNQPWPAASPAPSSRAATVIESLQDELALLQQARAALDARAAESALDTLALYEARFPAGRMHIEAQALRAEAQFVAGRLETGRSLARAFLASYPQSPAALRVRRLLDTSASGK